ncbi:MAG: MBOAT family protein, partial [Lachnospiraceae bacterium]|nr:MBOAT family protein [Lachnospiraceae bacterium]
MVLLLFSIIFYSWGEPVWVFAMIGLTFLDYIFANLMEKSKNPTVRKILLWVVIVADMFLLFLVKYYNFLVSSFDAWTGLKIPLL